MAKYEDYGAKRRHYPNIADFAWFSNEDMGISGNLTTGTLDQYRLSQAYVASIDLFEETQWLYEAQFHIGLEDVIQTTTAAGAASEALSASVSMLNKNYDDAYMGSYVDAEDEAIKSKLETGMFFGPDRTVLEVTSQIGLTVWKNINIIARWTPPQNMRLRTPAFYDISNESQDLTTAGVASAGDYGNPEAVASRIIWGPSRLRRSERRAIKDVIKYMLIDT